MSSHKMTKRKLPTPSIPKEQNHIKLPFDAKAIEDQGFTFSFSTFDRSHDLFNLGDNANKGIVSAAWFIDLMNCLKSVNNMTVQEVKSSLHDLHPVDWEKANPSMPRGSEQCEYWQFRLNKTKGRVVGILYQNVFYVVWLDPHHNLTNSKHYPLATKHYAPASEYDEQCLLIDSLKTEIEKLKSELRVYEDLFNNIDA